MEGGTTCTYKTLKTLLHTAPHVLRALLSHLTRAISDYIIFQVDSGAHCIQIFDSWGGQLPPDMWERWSKPYIEEVSWNDYGFLVADRINYDNLRAAKFSYTLLFMFDLFTYKKIHVNIVEKAIYSMHKLTGIKALALFPFFFTLLFHLTFP